MDFFFLMFSLYLVLAIFILIFVASGIKVLKEWERVVILRLGKFLGIRGPGIIWATPILDKIAMKISLREQQTLVNTETFVASDGNTRKFEGFVNWRITDPERAVLSVEDYRTSVETAIHHHVQKVGESLPSDAIIVDQDLVHSRIKQTLEPILNKWGVVITEINLKASSEW